MRYILDEEELQELRDKAKGVGIEVSQTLQTACSLIADKVPVEEGLYKGQIWGCILTTRTSFQYCDNCPARKLCPHEGKRWSK